MIPYLFFSFIVAALVAVLQANENDKLRRRLSETEKERDGWKARCGNA